MKVEAERLVQFIIAMEGKYETCVKYAEKYLNEAYEKGRANRLLTEENDSNTEGQDIREIPRGTPGDNERD